MTSDEARTLAHEAMRVEPGDQMYNGQQIPLSLRLERIAEALKDAYERGRKDGGKVEVPPSGMATLKPAEAVTPVKVALDPPAVHDQTWVKGKKP